MAKKTYDLLFKLLLIGVSVATGWTFAKLLIAPTSSIINRQLFSILGLRCGQDMHSIQIQRRRFHQHLHFHNR